MKSAAHIKGHPLHPILVGLPIAFFTGTLLFDILALIYSRDDFSHTALYLEITGIITGLLAAIPGAIDYFSTIPPESSAKKRGTQHALINILMLILFTIAFITRQREGVMPWIFITLEAIGFILICIAGWMGGTMVYRNMIGVYNRYADAGKWKEQYIKKDTGKIEVATANELKTDQMKLVHAKDKRIVIGRTKDRFVAFDDRCTHKGGSLAGGTMICGTVQCPWHGSQFDVVNGAVKAGPAKEKIKTYSVVEENGKVYVIL